MKNLILVSILGLVVVGCAHHDDVRPGADGVHTVRIQTDDEQEGSREAIKQANHYCGEYNKQAAFVEEDKKYTGTMDEKSYKNAKNISKAASMGGGTVWALGGKRESNIGGAVGLGGGVLNEALGDGYAISMKFKCQ